MIIDLCVPEHAISRMETLIASLREWVAKTVLMINDTKTDAQRPVVSYKRHPFPFPPINMEHNITEPSESKRKRYECVVCGAINHTCGMLSFDTWDRRLGVVQLCSNELSMIHSLHSFGYLFMSWFWSLIKFSVVLRKAYHVVKKTYHIAKKHTKCYVISYINHDIIPRFELWVIFNLITVWMH